MKSRYHSLWVSWCAVAVAIATLLSVAVTAAAEGECSLDANLTASSERKSDGLLFYLPGVPLVTQDNHRIAPDDLLSDPANVLVLEGRIFGNDCAPLTNAVIEVWYAGPPDEAGNYYSPSLSRPDYRGRQIITENQCGRYRFVQTFPVQFLGPSPHVHVRVSLEGSSSDTPLLVTEVYFQESLAQGFAPDASHVVQVRNEADGSRSAVFNLHLDVPGAAGSIEKCGIKLTATNDEPGANNGGVSSNTTNIAMDRRDTPVPATQPPVTQPPVTQPPVTPVPATQPPVTPVPATQLPLTQASDSTASQVSGNNNCALAYGSFPVTVSGGSQPQQVTALTVKGSTEGGERYESGRCFGVEASGPGVWFTVQGTGGTMVASTCHPGTALDTKISVYGGSTCAGLECVTANDDANFNRMSCPMNTLASIVTWESKIGTNYYIMVHGFMKRVGDFELSIEAFYVNDQCAQAAPLAIGEKAIGSTVDVSIPFEDNIARCQNDGGVVGGNRGLWYSMVGTGKRMQVSTCDEDTKIPNKLFLFKSTCDDGDEYRYVGDDDWDPDRQRHLQSGCQQNFDHDCIHPDPLDFLEHCIGGVHNANGSPNLCVSYQWDSIPGEQYYVLVTSSVYEGDIAIKLQEMN